MQSACRDFPHNGEKTPTAEAVGVFSLMLASAERGWRYEPAKARCMPSRRLILGL